MDKQNETRNFYFWDNSKCLMLWPLCQGCGPSSLPSLFLLCSTLILVSKLKQIHYFCSNNPIAFLIWLRGFKPSHYHLNQISVVASFIQPRFCHQKKRSELVLCCHCSHITEYCTHHLFCCGHSRQPNPSSSLLWCHVFHRNIFQTNHLCATTVNTALLLPLSLPDFDIAGFQHCCCCYLSLPSTIILGAKTIVNFTRGPCCLDQNIFCLGTVIRVRVRVQNCNSRL